MRWYMNLDNGYTPTKEELTINRFYISECEQLDIDVSRFDSSEAYTKEEFIAIGILSKGKKLLDGLEQALLDTKAERLSKNKTRQNESSFYTQEMEEDFNKLFGQ